MLYPAPAFPVPVAAPDALEEVHLELPDGGRVHGWARVNPEADIALVALHGNGENLGTLAYSGVFASLSQMGVSFLALDYPGYGRSPGKPTERGNVEAALAGLRWWEQRQPEARRVLFGWSLGAAVALQAARREPSRLAGLVLFSPWSSLEAVAREHFPGWLIRIGLLERYDSAEAAAEIQVPALVVHGREDQIIPVAQGAAVAERLAGPTRWVEVPGAGHNDLLSREKVWDELSDFLAGL